MDLLQGRSPKLASYVDFWKKTRLSGRDTIPWFHRELLNPDPSLVAKWAVRINDAVQRPRDKVNIIRDARSIVQPLLLAQDIPERTRYMFVTNDPAIRIAYRNYRRDEMDAGRRPIALNLRRPREFAPLINLGSMSNNNEMRLELFPKIERALDELLVGVSVDDLGERPERIEEIDRSLATLGAIDEAKGRFGRSSKIEKQIEQLRSWWSASGYQRTCVERQLYLS